MPVGSLQHNPDRRGLVQRNWTQAVDGLLIATLYCVAYLAAWFHSLDQWLLPVGLRAAVVLLIPRRWLWAWALGDILAMYLMRIPRADFDGVLWAYTTPLMVGPLFAVVPLAIKARLRTPERIATWLPLIAPACGLWSWACSWALSLVATSPNAFASLQTGLTWSLGSTLGVLLITLPPLLWLNRARGADRLDSPLTRDAVMSGLLVGAVAYGVAQTPELAPTMRLGLLMLTIVPVVALTFAHGWRGAALGAIAANVGVGITLPDFQREGAVDDVTLVAQQAMVVAMAALLTLGEAITRNRARAHEAMRSELAALERVGHARRLTENTLREHLLLMSRMQAHVDRGRQDLVEWLRVNERFSAALDLNSAGVEHRAAFEAYSTALYPIRVEQDGLYPVLASDAFTRFWVGDVPVEYRLRGDAGQLSLDLQLSAYRALCACFVVLCDAAPAQYLVHVRTWRRSGLAGIAIRAIALGSTREGHGNTAAQEDLEQRASTHGGAARVRHHARRVILLMSEPHAARGPIGQPATRPTPRHRPSHSA
jgi:hypothetical protein